MDQIPSLKTLDYDETIRNIPFFSFPGTKSCLTSMLEFRCYSKPSSAISNKSRYTNIGYRCGDKVPYGSMDLISSQHSIKELGLIYRDGGSKDIIPALSKHNHTVTRLHIISGQFNLASITSFRNLLEHVISSPYIHDKL